MDENPAARGVLEGAILGLDDLIEQAQHRAGKARDAYTLYGNEKIEVSSELAWLIDDLNRAAAYIDDVIARAKLNAPQPAACFRPAAAADDYVGRHREAGA